MLKSKDMHNKLEAAISEAFPPGHESSGVPAAPAWTEIQLTLLKILNTARLDAAGADKLASKTARATAKAEAKASGLMELESALFTGQATAEQAASRPPTLTP